MPLSSWALRFMPWVVLLTATVCSPPPPPESPATVVEPEPDGPCPKADDWLAHHLSYREALAPVISRAALDSGRATWLVAPLVKYPPRAITEGWEGRARVIGIVDTLGEFVHADVCGLQMEHPPGRRASSIYDRRPDDIGPEPLGPDVEVIEEWAQAIRDAVAASRITPLTAAGHKRNFVAVVPIYYRLR